MTDAHEQMADAWFTWIYEDDDTWQMPDRERLLAWARDAHNAGAEQSQEVLAATRKQRDRAEADFTRTEAALFIAQAELAKREAVIVSAIPETRPYPIAGIHYPIADQASDHELPETLEEWESINANAGKAL
ncbi:MAG: hypothetical protein JWO98_5307 [Frankiales bacterium]|nr:hypothetical protein [Frankiales bacterium]